MNPSTTASLKKSVDFLNSESALGSEVNKSTESWIPFRTSIDLLICECVAGWVWTS